MSQDVFKAWLQLPENLNPFLPKSIALDSLLNIGGQGVVFRGTSEGVDAAIKIYFPGQVDKRVEREVRALRNLECSSIVDVLWSDRILIQERELNVVATTFLTGQPLDKKIDPDNPLDWDELAIIGHDVATAIQAMWEWRIVHRDLKPSNLLIRPDGHACVIDLGFARHLDDSSLTQLGSTWGTFGYLSPEQTRRVRQLTCKSDVFALGVILMEGAMGRHPTFGDQLRLEAQGFHLNLPHTVSRWTHADLLKSMLNPSPTKRPLPNVIVNEFSRYMK